ncbi:MAG: hypothetical protein AB8D78_10005 [Akkermansiaceae bacterium]
MRFFSDVQETQSASDTSPTGASVMAKKAFGELSESRPSTAIFSEKAEASQTKKADTIAPKKILIIQGDWEAGMSRLALDLEDEGHTVGKVVFCFPDLIYNVRGIQTHTFREKFENFEGWLETIIESEGYDTVFLYNHYRPYNQVAWDLSEKLDLDCWVFELGLIRPNCVMVFDRENMPIRTASREWSQILKDPNPVPKIETPRELCRVSTPIKLTVFGTNFLVSRLTSPLYPNFVDQRDMKLWKHVKHGLIYLWRFFERGSDEDYDLVFSGELSQKYYTVPLQVHSDTQILQNSDFDSIEEFIEHVVKSFAKFAPSDTKLVFKVHPMDRGYKDYQDLINDLDQQIGGGRIIYVDRVHLPNLLTHTLGVVNINSSVGISALIHHAPVIALGKAVYDLPSLTFQGDLDDFWKDRKKPKELHVRKFLDLLLKTSQGRGTLSQRCFDVPGRCRIKWPRSFANKFFSAD